jgi:NDP-sugar pyrophosphorylase family protein
VDDAGRYGRVETGDGGRVTRFAEKQQIGEPGWINAGVYLVQRRLVEEIVSGRAVSLERELLPTWLGSKAVFGFRAEGPFLDIGTPESYAGAAAFFEELLGCRKERQLLRMGSP